MAVRAVTNTPSTTRTPTRKYAGHQSSSAGTPARRGVQRVIPGSCTSWMASFAGLGGESRGGAAATPAGASTGGTACTTSPACDSGVSTPSDASGVSTSELRDIGPVGARPVPTARSTGMGISACLDVVLVVAACAERQQGPATCRPLLSQCALRCAEEGERAGDEIRLLRGGAIRLKRERQEHPTAS